MKTATTTMALCWGQQQEQCKHVICALLLSHFDIRTKRAALLTSTASFTRCLTFPLTKLLKIAGGKKFFTFTCARNDCHAPFPPRPQTNVITKALIVLFLLLSASVRCTRKLTTIKLWGVLCNRNLCQFPFPSFLFPFLDLIIHKFNDTITHAYCMVIVIGLNDDLQVDLPGGWQRCKT